MTMKSAVVTARANRLSHQIVARYVADKSWENVVISEVAERQAHVAPDRVVVIDEKRHLTFLDIWNEAQRLAVALASRGLQRGEVISFQLPNWYETMIINLSASIGGFVCNPIIPIYRDAEVGFILRDASSRVLFIPDCFRSINYLEMIERLRPTLPDLKEIILVRSRHDGYENFDDLLCSDVSHIEFAKPDPNELKLLMYTSGTTGKPKGVMHTHNTLWAETVAVRDFWRITQADRVFMPSPVTHITGYLYALELPFASDIGAVLMEKWDPYEAVRLIDEHRATFTIGATPFLVELARAARENGTSLKSLRLFACGGAPVAPELILEATQSFSNCQAARIYGCTEAPTISAGTLPEDDPSLGAMTDGRILNTELVVLDPHGVIVSDGCEGEICVRGPELMVGYTDQAETDKAFDAEGFFHTGDLGFVSRGCFVTISGRMKDLIIRGGENLSPKEIEDCLITHRELLDASVVAAPHPRLGETVMAYLIAKGTTRLSLEDIAQHLQACGMARQKFPEHLEYVSEFPRTASGKVRKDILRVRAQESVRSR
jgi:acyl-CoA synthetase (AMP-forming)/AMP-acid ligase II